MKVVAEIRQGYAERWCAALGLVPALLGWWASPWSDGVRWVGAGATLLVVAALLAKRWPQLPTELRVDESGQLTLRQGNAVNELEGWLTGESRVWPVALFLRVGRRRGGALSVLIVRGSVAPVVFRRLAILAQHAASVRQNERYP